MSRIPLPAEIAEKMKENFDAKRQEEERVYTSYADAFRAAVEKGSTFPIKLQFVASHKTNAPYKRFVADMREHYLVYVRTSRGDTMNNVEIWQRAP